MNENSGGGRHVKSLSADDGSSIKDSSRIDFKSQVTTPDDSGPNSRMSKDETGSNTRDKQPSDLEQMKERFAKLLLGEDMSGGGKGVSSALALSNALTNLAASVFGEQHKLEPMTAERKARWRKEIDWILSVTEYIVEFVPYQQKNKDGSSMEIMVTRQRNDIHMNIPALRKLDNMLIDCLDNFKDQNEFYYVKDNPDSDKGNTKRIGDKWWLPTPKVPPNGLSETARKFLQYQKDCVNQVLKAAMAINAQVLAEMEIPESYIDSLPKNGRSSLGDLIYKSITVDHFDPDQLLSTMDLSSEHKILDFKNKIEASIVIWKRKMNQKDSKSTWGSAISLEKRELFEERAETILIILKHRFPGIPQSSLEISKIQFNRDIGHAILESYSRILESLAFTVLSRIEDVLYADYVTQNPSYAGHKRDPLQETPQVPSLSREEPDRCSTETPTLKTLSDFMGWGDDQNEAEIKKDTSRNPDELVKEDLNFTQKIANIVTCKKTSYLESLGVLRSPTSRH